MSVERRDFHVPIRRAAEAAAVVSAVSVVIIVGERIYHRNPEQAEEQRQAREKQRAYFKDPTNFAGA